MSRATFSITYEGTATEDGAVPIDQLATSLLAIGDLFAAATSLLHGGETKSVASVYAHRKTNSAEVSISIEFLSLVDKLKDLLTSDAATAAANMIAILLFVTGGSSGPVMGLIPFIRWCKNRGFTTHKGDGEVVTVETDDGEKAAVQQQVINLLGGRVNITQHVYNIVRPLENSGTDRITLKTDGRSPQIVTETDLPAFAPWEEEVIEEIEGTRKNMMLTVVQPTFKDGNRWRLSDGNVEFFAAVNDDEFLKRVRTVARQMARGTSRSCCTAGGTGLRRLSETLSDSAAPTSLSYGIDKRPGVDYR